MSINEQIQKNEPRHELLTLVIAPTNVLTIPAFRFSVTNVPILRVINGWFLRWLYKKKFPTVYDPDLADSWEGQTRAFESLLARLASRAPEINNRRQSRILFLSGDVHFGWTSRLQYWADRLFNEENDSAKPSDVVFMHLTSSAFKNESSYWRFLHRVGYDIFGDRLPKPDIWLGWSRPAAIGVSSLDTGRVAVDWVKYDPQMLRRTPPVLPIEDLLQSFVPVPEWRYRVDYILGEKTNVDFNPNMLLTLPGPNDDPEAWLEAAEKASLNGMVQKRVDSLERRNAD